jgi:putative SOS response-associated peptidase YedK
MCGRFTLRTPASAIAEQFSLLEVPDLQPRFNIAPSQPVAVVRVDPLAKETTPQALKRQLVFLHWGLVPSWADDPKIGNRMINARAETAADKPSFRAAMRRRRCLIVADGFYEWQTRGKRRQPMYIHLRDGRPFGFAGLWESWEGAGHSALESCTILTTAANDFMRPIHDRMPVIVPPADYALWLDPAEQQPDAIRPLLRSYPADEMEAYAVSPRVNSPTRDDEACLERVEGE